MGDISHCPYCGDHGPVVCADCAHQVAEWDALPSAERARILRVMTEYVRRHEREERKERSKAVRKQTQAWQARIDAAECTCPSRQRVRRNLDHTVNCPKYRACWGMPPLDS